ncbi:MAG: SpoIIE family protein phosphatase [Planctomycetaceae bacterium]
MAMLQAQSGIPVPQSFPLAGDRCILGRFPTHEVVIDDGAVSRTHAQITRIQGQYFIEDLRSRNGTLLNDEPLQGRGPVRLRNNDLIKICEVVLRFVDGAERGESPPARPVRDRPRLGATIQSLPGGLPAHNASSSQSALPELVEDGASSFSFSELSSAGSTELHVRPEQKLRAILEISRDLGGQLRLDLVLSRILASLFKIFPQADRGVVVLQEPGPADFKVKACLLRSGRDDLNAERISTTILRAAVSQSRSLLCANTLGDPQYMSESVTNLRIRSFLCVPLTNQQGGSLGAIQLDSFGVDKTFRQEDLDLLTAVCAQASLAIDNARLHEQALAQVELDRDREVSIEVQRSFLPATRPNLTGYSLFDFYRPARSVGGDLFDYTPLPDGRTVITVGDVAGKGFAAALLMARMTSESRSALLASGSPAQAMSELNQRFADGSLGHRFITMLMLTVRPGSSELTMVNAGHPPPLLRSADGTVSSLGIQCSGLPVGIEPGPSYQQSRFELRPGDTLLLFTDGVTDAENPERRWFGLERLKEMFARAGTDPESIIDSIVGDIEQFSAGAPRADDLCLICLAHTP